MRKIIYTLSLIGFTALVSCSKDYTCSCEVERVTTDGEITQYTTSQTIKDAKKNWAKDRCVSTVETEPETSNTVGGFPITTPGYTETRTCELN